MRPDWSQDTMETDRETPGETNEMRAEYDFSQGVRGKHANHHLTHVQQQALLDFRRKLYNTFEVESLILYGSAVRNAMDEESDIDLLVLTKHALSRIERHQITDLVFDINLEYGTNFSTLVVDHTSWESGAISILPIHSEISKEGIPV